MKIENAMEFVSGLAGRMVIEFPEHEWAIQWSAADRSIRVTAAVNDNSLQVPGYMFTHEFAENGMHAESAIEVAIKHIKEHMA